MARARMPMCARDRRYATVSCTCDGHTVTVRYTVAVPSRLSSSSCSGTQEKDRPSVHHQAGWAICSPNGHRHRYSQV